MRKVKFRAWDINNKKMFRVDRIDYRDDNFEIREVRRATEYPINVADQMYYDLLEIELMQFTGLKDVNGVEIYEGDIVRLGSFIREDYKKRIGQVVFERGKYIFYENVIFKCDLDVMGATLEVIGNVHQNQELMEDV